jgi:hypothetical protein
MLLQNNNSNYSNINYGPTKKVMLFTNARDEKKIKEWAAHHLLIGFDLIVIFDHKSIIPLKKIFYNFDKRVKVLRVENDKPIKLVLMKLAINIAKKLKVDWFLYLDADEFLILNNSIGVKRLLNNFPFAHSLSINWLMFGTNNLQKEPDGLILDNYTKSQLQLDKHVKTFVRPNEAVTATNPHFYKIRNSNRMFHVSNRIMNPQIGYSFFPNPIPFYKSLAYIAHYIYQSEETYNNRKVKLPRDDNGAMREKDGNIHKSFNEVTNNQPKNKYSQIVNDFLQSKK